jgi:hypothetical protein
MEMDECTGLYECEYVWYLTEKDIINKRVAAANKPLIMPLETSGRDLGTSGNEISKKLHFLKLFTPNYKFLNACVTCTSLGIRTT